tara:strand:+ start:422 stop:1150 length:729 start_codon:yes stop_codon:yes gene_type:complete
MINKPKKLRIKIFADGADYNSMIKLSKKKFIDGLTTNPSLMRKAGVKDYVNFSKKILKKIKKKSISLEVFADTEIEIEKQALFLSKLGTNVFVKIPIMNTKKKYMYDVIKKLSFLGIKLNITAIMTEKQIKSLLKNLNPKVENYISIFCGRIADTGRDPLPLIKKTRKLIKKNKNFKILWASTREVFNIFQADKAKCDIITVSPGFLSKLKYVNYNLERFSLDTVKTFYKDAKKSKYQIPIK